MREFTFAILTYNQEKLISKNLYSMKYIIEKYGNGMYIDLVVADDHSTDNTIKVVRRFVDKYRSLFREVSIIVSDQNKGIVNNYINGIKAINTNKFSFIAGDDFYTHYNLFDIVENGNYVIAPTIKYDGDNIITETYRRNFMEYVYKENKDLKKIIFRKFKFGSCLEAPGTFFDKNLVDSGFYDSLKNYAWTEDVPRNVYLLSKNNVKVNISKLPAVVYRVNTGVSNNEIPVDSPYKKDLERLQKEIHVYSDGKSILSICNKLINKIQELYLVKCVFRHNSRVLKFIDDMENTSINEMVYIKALDDEINSEKSY